MVPFRWSERDLKEEYDTAVGYGWMPFFLDAGRIYQFTPGQLLGLASRESGPFWKDHPTGDIVGDHGDAWGIFQINIKFHLDRENYLSVENNIIRGARILYRNRVSIENRIATATDPIDPAVKELMLPASYNRGVRGMWESGWLEHGDPDWPTASQNYAKDCVARAAVFARFIKGSKNG